jgi:hypothetical protein
MPEDWKSYRWADGYGGWASAWESNRGGWSLRVYPSVDGPLEKITTFRWRWEVSVLVGSSDPLTADGELHWGYADSHPIARSRAEMRWMSRWDP